MRGFIAGVILSLGVFAIAQLLSDHPSPSNKTPENLTTDVSAPSIEALEIAETPSPVSAGETENPLPPEFAVPKDKYLIDIADIGVTATLSNRWKSGASLPKEILATVTVRATPNYEIPVSCEVIGFTLTLNRKSTRVSGATLDRIAKRQLRTAYRGDHTLFEDIQVLCDPPLLRQTANSIIIRLVQ